VARDFAKAVPNRLAAGRRFRHRFIRWRDPLYNLYQWGGAGAGSLGAAGAGETLIARLGYEYWADPELLYHAAGRP
jgi:hypothetical protein